LVTVRFEGQPRSVERFCGPAQVARRKGDLGLGNDTPRAGYRFFLTEGARSIPQKLLRSGEIA
jgi:hypothetical protein